MFSELFSLVADFERRNGVIDLRQMVTTNCQCTGSACSTGCQGNKGL